ncbi:MAG TPA: dihydrolipoamide acetyltransferase family protein [Tepidisphaeraceae bacterium]|nr:dihydrolipoamide acetyltransferase family protein [Tepidisphaeraceae bacterium]
MPVSITMPQLSDTMTEGTVVKWLKKEGDKVKANEVIAEVETDKATMEMESFEGGTLAHIAAPEGTKVAVGQAIAFLASSKENAADVKKQLGGAAGTGGGAKAPAAKPPAVVESPAQAAPREKAAAMAAMGGATTFAQASVGEMHEPDNNLAHGATREDISTEPHTEEDPHDGRFRASPLARKIAADRGVDLSQVKGSGPGGRIVKQDVLTYADSNGGGKKQPAPQQVEARPLQPAQLPVPVTPQRVAAGGREVVPMTKMRQVIATRLQQSKQQIPHFYETVDIDAEEISKLRGRLNEQLKAQNIKLSIGDLVAKAVATALIEHPALNAHFTGNEVVRFGDVNLGMAVALPEGLIVPVLRGINHMSLREIRVRSADLVDRARKQRLKQDEMTGATFTVSNLGMFGVREFSAIINPPEVGILAVGGAEKRAVVRNDQIVARTMMTVTLSADHRAVDGAVAAEFLTTLRQLIEEPGLMLV